MHAISLKKKFLAIFSLLLLSFSFYGIVLASSYNITYSFSVGLTGATRSFNGQNIAFESTFAKSAPAPVLLNKYYAVTLKRDVLGPDDTIGTVNLKRDAYGLAKWSNVGPGNYYIYMTKANDGVTLSDNNAKIYNY